MINHPIQQPGLQGNNSSQYYMLDVAETTQIGVTLHDDINMPPTVYTHALSDDFRGLFCIVLRDDFHGTAHSKRKAQIVRECIQYVFRHGDRRCIKSIEEIGDFLEFKIGLTKRRFPHAFNQLSSWMHNANTTVARRTLIQRKGYPGKVCK